MSHPVWNRDYFYLNGKVAEVREYMRENCVHTVAEDLLALALDIFSRYDNRRRMGVEVMVLTMLATPNITKWEVNIYLNVNHINKRKSRRRPLLGPSPWRLLVLSHLRIYYNMSFGKGKALIIGCGACRAFFSGCENFVNLHFHLYLCARCRRSTTARTS